MIRVGASKELAFHNTQAGKRLYVDGVDETGFACEADLSDGWVVMFPHNESGVRVSSVRVLKFGRVEIR